MTLRRSSLSIPCTRCRMPSLSPLNAEGAAGHKARQQNHPTLEGLLVLAIMVVMLTNASFTSLGARE